ncbi:MAG: class I SAM-dependent methyltransferase [bacterium]
MSDERPRMYHDLAQWFHLLTAPEDYEEEAELFYATAEAALGRKPGSWLELGSGGGNNASHYSKRVREVVLSDRSEEMLALSRTIHPQLEHVQGDMLTIRLGRSFDVVFVHDAASYLTTEDEVRQLAATAAAHCKPGGVTVICPDNTAENLEFGTDHGGHDGDGRAMRYLEWTTPGAPGTYEYVVDYAYIYHEDGQPPRVELDRHINGALPEAVWLAALEDAGFQPTTVPFIHSEVPDGGVFFVGRLPA